MRRKSNQPSYQRPGKLIETVKISRDVPNELLPTKNRKKARKQNADRQKRRLFHALRQISSEPYCKNRHRLNLNNSKLVNRRVVCIQCEQMGVQ